MAYENYKRKLTTIFSTEEILRIQPNFSLKKHAGKITYKNKEDVERAISALRKAGLK
jgi:hypothetical protein